MPIYEYRCEDCGTRFQQLTPLRKATRRATCPNCASKSVRKLVSAFASPSVESDSGGGECPTCATGVCDL
jgi:putative FmdB family regulatory protein